MSQAKLAADIEALIQRHPEGLSRSDIVDFFGKAYNIRSLQRVLASLVQDGRIMRQGRTRAARYYPLAPSDDPGPASTALKRQIKDKSPGIFGPSSLQKLEFLATPPYQREIVGYNRAFLDEYLPNQHAYLPPALRKQLYQQGKRIDGQLAAGTYARQICQRLLIDLSYNSSRLEGNTYSKLDTQRLVEKGVSAEGKVLEETIMIGNHKEAILFIVENAEDLELNSMAICNLHHVLSQDLLANPESCGKIRNREVYIGQSTYKPLANPHRIKELLELILIKARQIKDPFEQSFFMLVHLSYLQAFEDVNKRTSRISCNIPFIKENLCPLSFTDVSREDYTAALLAVYEKNQVEPMVELYAWAYLRSCEQYGVVKRSLGEVDAFRILFRKQKKEAMGHVVRNGLHGKKAADYIEDYAKQNGIEDIAKFSAMTLGDLSILHDGAIVGLGITVKQLNAWLSKRDSGLEK